MTKDRRLAVKMWRDIAYGIRTKKILNYCEVLYFKKGFVRFHGLKWYNNCWFCEYQGKRFGCKKCRLYVQCGCGCSCESNYFGKLRNMSKVSDYKEMAEYASKIADILEGK